MTRPRRRRVFSRRDDEVLAAAESWARAMRGALRELTPEAADNAAEMYLRDLPGRRLEDVRVAFRAVAARAYAAEEKRRLDMEQGERAETYAEGDRVVVAIGDRAKWNADAASALDGQRGRVAEVKPGYHIPVAGTGVGPPQTGYLVELDAEVRLDDREATRPIRAFHFLAEDLRREQPS